MDIENELQSGVTAPETPELAPVDDNASVADTVRQAFEKHKASLSESEESEKPEKPDQKARDEQGRFAQKPKEDAAKPEAEDEPAATQPDAVAPKAPVGWSPAAKAQFDRLPSEVKDAIAKRESEVDRGFAILSEYKGLEQFTPALKAAGISHAEFANRAVQWERDLQSKPAQTAEHVLRLAAGNMGVHPVQFAANIFRQAAQAAGLTPQQATALLQGTTGAPQLQAPRPPQPQAPVITPDAIKEMVNREFQTREINSQVEQFLKDPANTHAQVVFDDMATLIESGRAANLKDAYDMACWMNPEIRTQLISQPRSPAKTTSNVAKAQAAAKAVTGAPGRASPSPAPKVGDTVMDAVRAAYQSVSGAL